MRKVNEYMYTSGADIEEFLREYRRSRVIIESSVKAVLNRALEYEQIFKKVFCQFTKEEIIKMYGEAHTRSVRSLSNWNLILKHASLWFLDKQHKPLDNQYNHITKEDLQKCIDIDIVDKMMISRSQLNMMQDELINKTDQAILELLFLGITGWWMRELTYLTPEQLSHSDMCIYFKTGKIVPLDERAYDMLQDAFEETELASYNATTRISKVQGNGVYKARFNSIHENSNPKDERDAERRARWLQRRIMIVSEYLDVPLTPKTLSASGLWHYSHIEMQRMGIEDFKVYIFTNEGRKLANRYGFDSDYYANILIDKYRKYL